MAWACQDHSKKYTMGFVHRLSISRKLLLLGVLVLAATCVPLYLHLSLSQRLIVAAERERDRLVAAILFSKGQKLEPTFSTPVSSEMTTVSSSTATITPSAEDPVGIEIVSPHTDS